MTDSDLDPSAQRLAVLIDADNAPANMAQALFVEIARYGMASVKRIYGDWSKPHLAGWRDVVLRYALEPVQQFAYTKGKDATDMQLIINAMDLLHEGHLQGFCLVSSDSDFTPLAQRIRASGLLVYVAQAFLLVASIFGLDYYVKLITRKINGKHQTQ